MKKKQEIQIKRFYRMDKSLQLIEGTNVSALWAHLVDTYNYFFEKEMIEIKNTIYQSSATVEAFTGIKVKAQASARKRLEELGFLKYTVTTVPGRAIKSTFYILYPEKYKEWVEAHNYDLLRDEKFKELQKAGDHEKLDKWLKNNLTEENKKTLDRIGQMQNAKKTFANPTSGHLLTPLSDICKTQKDGVIETIGIENIEVENTQSNKGCVFSGADYPYLNGKNHDDLLDEIIEYYTEKIKANHPDFAEGLEFDNKRYIGDLTTIDTEFKRLDISTAANFFVGIHGYFDRMEEELLGNQHRFKAAHRLEKLLRYEQGQILNRDYMKRGELVCNDLYNSVLSTKSL